MVMLWLDSMRNRKDTILDLQIPSEPVYALGVHFHFTIENPLIGNPKQKKKKKKITGRLAGSLTTQKKTDEV